MQQKETKRLGSEQVPSLKYDLTYSEDRVDLSLIRWMLSMTSTERLQIVQQHIRAIIRLHGDKDKALIPILQRTLEEKLKQ
jgi:hypothetical protein